MEVAGKYQRFKLPALPAKGKGSEDLMYEVLDDLYFASATRGCYLLKDGAKGSQVLRSAAAQAGVTQRPVTENCGAAYQELIALRKRGGAPLAVRGGAGGGGGAAAAAAAAADEYKAATPEERRAMSVFAAKGDYYGLLGLTALNLAATDAQIRSAHTRQVKRFHPDKAKSGTGGGSEGAEGDADAENVFLQLNNAFEAMIVPEKRRAFDSTYEFDDTIPTDAKAAKGDFFALFAPVFERNARFSSIHPVPKLGGPQDDDATVKAFYTFWANFDSWRVFTHTGPNKLTGSEGREERRHLEKENLAAAAKAKKAEIARVNTLTERARAHDPRVQELLRREKDAREAGAKAKARAEADKAAEAEAERARAAEEARAREAAELDAKRGEKFTKEREKKLVSRAKAALRKAAEAGAPEADPLALSLTNIEFLLALLEGSAAVALHAQAFGAEAAAAVQKLATSDAEKACAPKDKKAAGGGGGAGGGAAGGAAASGSGEAPKEPLKDRQALLDAIAKARGVGK